MKHLLNVDHTYSSIKAQFHILAYQIMKNLISQLTADPVCVDAWTISQLVSKMPDSWKLEDPPRLTTDLRCGKGSKIYFII